MKRLYQDVKPWLALLVWRRRRLLTGTLLAAVTLLAGIALLGLSGWFITACGLAGIALAAGLFPGLDIYVPGSGIRFFALLRTVSRYLERLYNHDTVLTLLADLRYRVFGHLTRLDDAVLKRRRASDWLSRLTADIDTLDNLYLRLLIPPLVGLLCIALVAGFIALWLPAVGAVMALAFGVLWVAVTVGFARSGFASSHRQVAQQESLRRLVLDQLQGAAELKSYQTSGWHRDKIEVLESETLLNQRQLALKTVLGNVLVPGVTALLVLAVLALAGQIHVAGGVSGPVMLMAAIAVMGLSEVLAPLPAAFVKLGASHAAAKRLNALADTPVMTPTRTLPETSVGHELQLINASYCYPGAAQSAVAGLTMTLPAGNRAIVTGSSGAGKSTFAQLVMGRLVPSEGVIKVAGEAPSDIELQSRSDHLMLLTQQVDLFDASLADNLRVARAEASEAQLWEVLDKVALGDWARRQPRQLHTPVGEKGQQLSGGQARRVALARLMLRDPSVVLLDEPFAGVDQATANVIAAALNRWLVGRTAIIFIHQINRMELLPSIDYAWHLADGQLVERALPDAGEN